nr:EOG090X0F1W [Macrothrix elegans]
MGSNELPSTFEDTVLVTGFGSFGVHSINSSTETVNTLASLGIEDEIKARLVTVTDIPVVYDHVKKLVPQLWQQYKPKLVVHAGLSGTAQGLTLETQAFNYGYCSKDVNGCIPQDSICQSGLPGCLQSAIDMRSVCHYINDSPCGVLSCISTDPGRYLCDYIYYTSLSIDSSRTAFVHVPVLGRPYSALQLAQALKIAITQMLKQVRENDFNKVSDKCLA